MTINEANAVTTAYKEKSLKWNLNNSEILLGKMTRNEYCISIITYVDEINFKHGVNFYPLNGENKNLEIKIDGRWILFNNYTPYLT